VIEVHMDDGRIYQDRIHQSEVGADFSMAIETYSADEGAYDLRNDDPVRRRRRGRRTDRSPTWAWRCRS
jgi:hypothetical protein